MNMYRRLGDATGTGEGRELAEQLVMWHDAMVKHLRIVAARGRAACNEGCPHEEAASLWHAAQQTFAGRASALAFLRLHGHRAARVRGVREETRPEMRA
jgi:hypothetical protein